MAKYSHAYGGVGAPVGLTVFKTAGGSLGAVPGGFDSHTPLPRTFVIDVPSGITLENQKIRTNFRKSPQCDFKTSAPILESPCSLTSTEKTIIAEDWKICAVSCYHGINVNSILSVEKVRERV
jgi:hypothetical protein